MNENRCVCCGEIIPEGRQVCLHCEKGETEKIQEMARIMFERSPYAKRPIYDIKGKSVSLGENSTKFLDNILEEIFIPFLATELYEAGYRKVEQGEWIVRGLPRSITRLCQITHEITCTKCGFDTEMLQGMRYNYCPNCGAKMKGE